MHMPALDDTIIAVSSGWQADPLGIVRLSGDAAFDLLRRLGVMLPTADARPRAGWHEARLALTDELTLPATVYWFHTPHSYTGQDVGEVHTVGSLPALRELSARLIELGARRALPGEFTARAYLNGRLDASQVDGVFALINAENDASARQAARLTHGSHPARFDALRDRLTDLIARVEAGIDFVEEEDVRFITPAELHRCIDELVDPLAELGRPSPMLHRAGRPHVALVGLPNAGKSTLFNTLLGRQRAIVSPVLGTTRDVLSAEVQASGIRLVLQDCAGLGASADELESAAHLAAEQAADQADLVLWVHDCTGAWDPRETAVCRRIPQDRRVLVLSKRDQISQDWGDPVPIVFSATAQISSVSGAGLKHLRRIVAERLEMLAGGDGGVVAGEQIGAAVAALTRARDATSQSNRTLAMPEIVALELRRAWQALESIGCGPVVEDVLGRIFDRFCIGK